jgi:hypothetical protein
MAPLTEILRDSPWQMTFGERAALEGVLSQLRPAVAIEIGTAEGGSLQRVAKHSEHVHSFDLVEPDPAIKQLGNVTLHTGDSHVLLKQLLAELAAAGTNVDFVLVDGDHSADGAEEDLRDLLSSEAVGQTVILMHDTLNDEVREGFARVDFGAEGKVVHADLDFVAGHLSEGGDFHHQLWGGLGLVLVDAGGEPVFGAGREGERFYDIYEIVAGARDAMAAAERGEAETAGCDTGDEEIQRLREELGAAHAELAQVKRSPSWRLTAPLRAAKRAVNDR